jgi:hypothetical protein
MIFVIIFITMRNIALCFITLLCFVSNSLLAYIHRYVRPLGASADEVMFERLALEWSTGGIWSVFSTIDVTQSHIFSSFAALLFSIFGYEPILVNYFGGFMGALIVVYSYKLAFSLTSNKNFSMATAIFAALLPSLHIISILFLRDIYIIFFVLAGFHSYSIWRQKQDIKSLLIAVCFFMVGGLFHTAILATLFLLFVFESIYRSKNLGRSLVTGRATIAGIVLSLFIPFLVLTLITGWALGVGASKVNQAVSLFQGDERALKRLSGEIVKTDSEVIIYPPPRSSNMLGVMANIPERLVYILVAPFPWMYKKITDIPRILDSLIVFAALILFMMNLKMYKSRDSVFLPIITIVISYVIFSLGTFDVLTGSRHRLKYMIPLVIFVASVFFIKNKSVFSVSPVSSRF